MIRSLSARLGFDTVFSALWAAPNIDLFTNPRLLIGQTKTICVAVSAKSQVCYHPVHIAPMMSQTHSTRTKVTTDGAIMAIARTHLCGASLRRTTCANLGAQGDAGGDEVGIQNSRRVAREIVTTTLENVKAK